MQDLTLQECHYVSAGNQFAIDVVGTVVIAGIGVAATWVGFAMHRQVGCVESRSDGLALASCGSMTCIFKC